MGALSTRLPHIITRNDMVVLLTTTYGVAQAVEDDDARERLTKALATDRTLMDDLLRSIEEALATYIQPGTDANALLDKFSKRVATRAPRIKDADGTKAAALLVRINMSLGLVPEPVRLAMESEKGKATQRESLRAVGAFLVQQLLK
jgi:hypothetical protein